MKPRIPAGLLLALTALTSLLACEEAPPAQTPAPAASDRAAPGSATKAAAVLPPLAAGVIDVSGCWRPVGAGGVASGGPFEFKRVSANAFVFTNQPLRTKLVFTPGGNFDEVNYDEAKPFFPKGYVHSSGSISADGNGISRSLIGTTNVQNFRRCALVSEAPRLDPDQAGPGPSASPSAGASLSPIFLPASPKPGPSATPTTPATPTKSPEPSPVPEGQIPDTGPRALSTF